MTPDPQQALDLRDIHLPAAPPFWPPAPGWWLLAALLLALLAVFALRLWRRWRLQAQRRRVLDAVDALAARLSSERSTEALTGLSVLLRQMALARYPRREVAVLTGAAWLRFLDETGGEGRFTEGPGRWLASAPYQRALPARLDLAGLVGAVHEWVERNSANPPEALLRGGPK